MKFIVNLKNSKTKFSYDLTFDLIESSFLSKWIDQYKNIKYNNYSISEPWALYNLNPNFQGKDVIKELNKHIDICNSYYNCFDKKISDPYDQNTLNYLHNLFSILHKKDIGNDNFKKSLSTINQLIHYCESLYGSKRVRIVWFEGNRSNLFTNEDYKLFTTLVDFGGLYHLYSDVGKPLDDLAEDQDEYITQFCPNLHYSADCIIRFTSRSNTSANRIKENSRLYYQNHKEEFESWGYYWGDPKLSVGHIKLGQLVYNDQEEILKNVSKCDTIYSTELEENYIERKEKNNG